jgi:ribosomal protein S18 acetylase RimI-like enzyme
LVLFFKKEPLPSSTLALAAVTREEAAVKQDLPRPATLTAARIERFEDEADLHAIAEAAIAAILDGGGFGWVKPPKAAVMEQYFRGVVLVPERELIAGRMDGVIYGAAQLLLPSRNNEAQAFAASIMHHFVAPYARGHGLARLIIQRAEDHARALGYHVLNLDVRETQGPAIALYEAAGFICWGTHPAYARVKGANVGGRFYYKLLK